MSVIAVLISYLFSIALCIEKDVESNPVSCMGLEDGLHYIRPYVFVSSDDIDTSQLPSILVKCSSGWTIFDHSLDPHISQYFTSFMQITDDFGSMDVGYEHINWQDWMLMKHQKLSISEDCNTCLTERDAINADIAYYMTGNYYGCSFATKALCDMDQITLECSTCTMPTLIDDDTEYPGLCTHLVLPTNDADINTADTTHQKCVTYKWNYLPSLGLNGQFCPCFQPDSTHFEQDVEPLYIEDEAIEDEDDEIVNCDENVIHLKNEDFLSGTYRIRSCGTYKLAEDVKLNMNAPIIKADVTDYGFNEYLSPNDADYWWPTEEQMKDDELYPSNNFIGAYAMGFFSGISIEHDDVTVDLNGYKLEMHHDFYVQQRFFSLIEMASKPFISGQGPTNFGNVDVVYPSNIVIKNGILGLTSHHAIHGNNNNNVKIFDVKMIDFEVSGIAINGFNGLTIEDVDIGPNYQNVPVTPQYAHGRFMLQRLALIPDLDDAELMINKEMIKATDIIDTLQDEMDQAFEFSYNVDEVLVDDEIYNNLFVNLDGLPHGGTLYGMFFNSEGASVFGLGLSPGHSMGLTLRNINIHGLRSNPMETVRAQLQRGPFNDLLDMERIITYAKDTGKMKYQGTSYSNAQYAIAKLIPDTWWSVLGHTFINKQVDNWIANNRNLHTRFKCNADIMLHLTKGIFGIRVDNVQDIEIDGYLNIESLHNLGQFGNSDLCGEYSSSRNGGHHNQVYPQQIGYTGNEVHAITFIGSSGSIKTNANVYINDLISARGSSFGINFYGGNDFKIEDNAIMVMNNIHAGAWIKAEEEEERFTKNILPNTPPRSCVIDVWTNDDDNKVKISKNAKISTQCVTKYDSCSFRYSLIDSAFTEDNDILNVDIMEDVIDNIDCEYEMDEEDQTFLDSIAKISDYHSKTVDLLKLQTKDIKIDARETTVLHGDHVWLLMSIISANFLLIIAYLIWGKERNGKGNQLDEYVNSELAPLINRET